MDRLRLLVNVARLTTNIAHGCGTPDLMLTQLDMTFPANVLVLINQMKFFLSIPYAVSTMHNLSKRTGQSGVLLKEEMVTFVLSLPLKGFTHEIEKITKTTSLTHIIVEAPARLTPPLDMIVSLVKILTFFTVILLDSALIRS